MEFKERFSRGMAVFGILLLVCVCVLVVWAVNQSKPGLLSSILPQRATDTPTVTPTATLIPTPTATLTPTLEPTPVSYMGKPQEWSSEDVSGVLAMSVFVFMVVFLLFVLFPLINSRQ